VSQSSGPVAQVRAPLAASPDLQPLVDEIARAIARPLNVQQVAALLETAGVTDAQALSRYGYTDVFALAQDVAEAMWALPVEEDEPEIAKPAPDRKAMVRDYLRGPFSLLPLLLLAGLLNSYQTFGGWGNRSVLMLSTATIGSLLVTGGFVQAMARKGSIYLSQGYYRATRTYLVGLLKVTAGVVLLAAVCLAVVASATGVVTRDDRSLLSVAFLMLSTLWMLAGILGLLKQTHWFGIGLAGGALLSYGALYALAPLGMRPSTLVGVAAGIAFVVAVGTMAIVIQIALWSGAPEPADVQVVPPPRAHLLVALAPYFTYGVTYLLVILAGHVGGWVGWVPPGSVRMEAIAISELGLTLALIPNMLVGGVSEHTMQRFWERVRGYQMRARAATPAAYGESLREFYAEEQRRFLLALCGCTVALVGMLSASLAHGSGVLLGMVWAAPASLVAGAGMVGYGLLALGAFDTMLLITLSQPRFALEALLAGFVVTLGSSIALGVGLGYAYGALGTVIGSAAYLAIVRVRFNHLIHHADYYTYASF
jgi:hypothetical protein